MDGTDYDARLAQPLVRWLRENRGERAVAAAAAAAGVPLATLDGRSAWFTRHQFETLLEAARREIPDERTFCRASSWRLADSYGAMRFVVLAMTPAGVISRSVAAYPHVCRVDRPEIVEATRTSARIVYVGGPSSRLTCLLRQSQVAELPRLWGLPRAKVDEVSCTGLGDRRCEYRIRWVRSASRWPALAGALLAGGSAWLIKLDHSPWAVAAVAMVAGGAAAMAWAQEAATRRSAVMYEETEEALSALVAQEAAARREAQEAILARDEFMALAAHELRSPVAAMRLASQQASRMSQGAARLASERAVRSADRAARLVDDMMLAGAAASGRLEVSPRPCDLSAVVGDVADRMAGQLEAAGCELSVRAVSVRGVWDAGRVDQAVTNLLSNAARHAPGHPVILSVGERDGSATVMVCDRGPGVDPARIGTLFDRFERGSGSGGLGVGLWVVSEVARAHGGTARAFNRAGGGLCVEVELPGASAPERPTSAPTHA